ncbi:flavin reductase family protein [uncultured Sphingomonas sp.]|uniref:flavin reductase family protein n=1 Tax=uncultured Sphingomonas sp. TaxID=158754 RepID=UPI0030F9586C
MTEWHFYEPAKGHGLPHDPLNAIVGPRPIGWIATMARDGRRNLAPYSFFNLFSYRPPIVGFCSNGAKDSLANARETGEFVWNLATRDLATEMNETSAMTDEDEFSRAGLATLPSTLVAPPRVALSPVQFECKVTQIVQLQDRHGADVPGWLVLGEAVAIHIDTAMLEGGIYQTARAHPILRGGGPADYFALGEKFAMTRPG